MQVNVKIDGHAEIANATLDWLAEQDDGIKDNIAEIRQELEDKGQSIMGGGAQPVVVITKLTGKGELPA